MSDLIAGILCYLGKKRICQLCFIGRKFARFSRDVILRCKLSDSDPTANREWWFMRENFDISISDETLMHEIRRNKLLMHWGKPIPRERLSLFVQIYKEFGDMQLIMTVKSHITYAEYLIIAELPDSIITGRFELSDVLLAVILIKNGRYINRKSYRFDGRFLDSDEKHIAELANWIRNVPGFIDWFVTNPISANEDVLVYFDRFINPGGTEDILRYHPHSRIYPIVRNVDRSLADKYAELVSQNRAITGKQMADLHIMLKKPTNLIGIADMFFYELSPESVDHLLSVLM